jgi:Mlc titration factor MtfA (ptsG expression regulator)
MVMMQRTTESYRVLHSSQQQQQLVMLQQQLVRAMQVLPQHQVQLQGLLVLLGVLLLQQRLLCCGTSWVSPLPTLLLLPTTQVVLQQLPISSSSSSRLR